MRSDELRGEGFAHIGPPSIVEFRLLDWTAGDYLSIGALARDSAMGVQALMQEVAELYSGQTQYPWARAIHKQSLEITVDVLENHGHVRAFALQQKPTDWSLNAGNTAAVLPFGHPRHLPKLGLRCTVPIWDSEEAPTAGETAIFTLNKCIVSGITGEGYNASNFMVRSFTAKGEGDVSDSDQIGDVTVGLVSDTVLLATSLECTITAGSTTSFTCAATLGSLATNALKGFWAEIKSVAGEGRDALLAADVRTKIVKANVTTTGVVTIFGAYPITLTSGDVIRVYYVR